MSRFDGWLVRYIMMRDTPARLTIKKASKQACVRQEAFVQALGDPKLVRLDAKWLGIDADEMRATFLWMNRAEAEQDARDSMIASAKCVTPKRNSETRHGSRTRLGVSCPNPGGARNHRDELNLPINPIPHPEPEGEWHPGLDAAG